MTSPEPRVLLAWRGTDPTPPAPFDEAYYCPACDAYFGLALAPGSQPLAPGVSVLAPLNGPAGPVDIRCPGCGAAHPEYGKLGGTAAPPARPTVAELLVTTFPPRAPRAAQVRVGRLIVERFVLLLSGPLPPPSMLADFVETACASMIELMIRAPVRGGAVPLNVLAVDGVSDDTQWLSALLDTHVYKGTLGVRVFASLGPLEAPSGTQVLLCPVGSGPAR